MNSNENSLIIDRPDLVPSGQKLTAWGITLLFWAALLYLWQPLLSLVAWGLNIHLFYNHMILFGGYRTFLDLLKMYLTVIALLGGGLIFWARINQWRFRGRERRADIGSTDLVALYSGYGLEPSDIGAAASHRIISATFVGDGKITLTPRD